MLPKEVIDRESFIKFVEALTDDFNKGSGHWDKTNLVDFLEAISGYAEDIQGYYDNNGQPIKADIPTWRVFADILKGASMYE